MKTAARLFFISNIVFSLLVTSCSIRDNNIKPKGANLGAEQSSSKEIPEIPEEEQILFEKETVESYFDLESLEKALFSVGYAASAAFSFYSKDASGIGSGIASLLSALSLWGLDGHTGEPTIQDVLNKLDTMDRKIDALTSQLNNFAAKVQADLSYITYGIDQTLYESYKRDWESFQENYVEKLDAMQRNHTTKYAEEFTSRLINNSSDDYTIRIYLQKNKKGNWVNVTANPDNPYEALDGSVIEKTHLVRIPMSYLKPLKDEYNKTHSYTNACETVFESCLKDYLKANPSMAKKVNSDQILSSTKSDINLAISTKEEARDANNLFLNYAKHITGASGTSALDSFYKMTEYYYNFQDEAKSIYATFQARMRDDLDDFYRLAKILRVYSRSDIDTTDAMQNYLLATQLIQNKTNLKNVDEGYVYSYVMQHRVRTKLVRLQCYSYFSGDDYQRWFGVRDAYDSSIWYSSSLGTLVSQTKFNCMYARYKELLAHVAGLPTDFVSYLAKYGAIDSNCRNEYNRLRNASVDTGQTLPEFSVPVVCNVDDGNPRTLTSESFKCYCYSNRYGYDNYYHEGGVYSYGSKGDKDDGSYEYWSGEEIEGTVIDIGKENVPGYTLAIDRWVRYDESHSYWINDEHYAFGMYKDGLACYAFFAD